MAREFEVISDRLGVPVGTRVKEDGNGAQLDALVLSGHVREIAPTISTTPDPEPEE